MHVRARRALQDTLTSIRLKTPVAACGHALHPNGERHLRSRARLAGIYPPELLAETLAIAERCRFSLDELRYEYPEEIVPPGETAASWLRKLVERGLAERYDRPGIGVNSRNETINTYSSDPKVIRGDSTFRCMTAPASVRALIEHELALIAELGYEPYFLTVHDIVAFARSKDILCQGRGSAANSAVCYALGITEVDPARMQMLFERFISRERNEPPDIDVDFEHQRREEVMQYIYGKYGRDRAALAATLITLPAEERRARRRPGAGPRSRSARSADQRVRLVGRARHPRRSHPRGGFDPDNPVIRRVITLAGRPARLSTPPVAARRRLRHRARSLERMVPVENAAMPESHRHPVGQGRSRRDGPAQGRVLALGMLSAIRRALDMVSRSAGQPAADAGHPGRGPGRLRDDPARRHHRRVPDRIARAAVDAAAIEARRNSTIS